MDRQSVIREITAWDGKQVDSLKRLQQTLLPECSGLSLLVDLLEQKNELQVAVTWLLKRQLESGCQLSAKASDRLLQLGVKLENWQSILHFLQFLEWLPITENHHKALEVVLRCWINHENKFVRAWCYNAWYLLADQYPQYRHEVVLFFEMAMRDEAPSVKARIRKIEKQGLWGLSEPV